MSKPPRPGQDRPGPQGKEPRGFSPSRRRFFRLTLAVGAGAGVLSRLSWRGTPKEETSRASVLHACVGCTGCVPLCPTMAIVVIPGGIALEDEKCIQCGYCAAACPVGGIRVNKARDHD